MDARRASERVRACRAAVVDSPCVVGRGELDDCSIGGVRLLRSRYLSLRLRGTPLGFVLFAFSSPVPFAISLVFSPLLPGLLRGSSLSSAPSPPRALDRLPPLLDFRAGGDVALQDRDLEVEVAGGRRRGRGP